MTAGELVVITTANTVALHSDKVPVHNTSHSHIGLILLGVLVVTSIVSFVISVVTN